MAATTMASAAAAVVILYYVLNRKLSSVVEREDPDGENYVKSKSKLAKKRSSRRPDQAPANWLETISTLSETLRFTYSETLGKWPIGDLAFGINYLIKRQGNLLAASVYACENSVELKGPEIALQLSCYVRLINLCFLFSKRQFPVFLASGGFSERDVLLQKPKAGILKPAFTVLQDETLKCFLLLVRGTHSIKDTLTAATGAVVPFHHSVMCDGGINNVVLGYAHCGMVAAARWIAKLSSSTLIKALEKNPDYEVKIIGHSLGGGTAALLAYILRERKELSATTCVAFAPAACMTWELAESGKPFITAVVNGSDLVPTFSAASVDDLRSEVMASSWLNDLRDQVERNRVLNAVYRSATAVGSRLPSISYAKATVVGAGALLRPVSNHTQGVVKRAQDVAQAVANTRISLSSWSCVGPRRRVTSPSSNDTKDDDISDAPLIGIKSESLVTNVVTGYTARNKVEYCSSSGCETCHDDTDEDEDIQASNAVGASTDGAQLWYELEKNIHREDHEMDARVQEEEEAISKEITEEEKVFTDSMERKTTLISSPDASDNLLLYPPGRIMHLVSVPSIQPGDVTGHENMVEERAGIFETPRELYSKIRLSKTMINDHYMPVYKRMMEQVIKRIEAESDPSSK